MNRHVRAELNTLHAVSAAQQAQIDLLRAEMIKMADLLARVTRDQVALATALSEKDS